MKIINPNQRRFILLIILLATLLFIFRLLQPFVTQAEQLEQLQVVHTQKVMLNPVTSYFSSPSTTQGRRRFLAIGNFYDTTNSAYFLNSKSFLSFSLPDLRIASAKLILYKYAHGGSTPAQLRLYKDTNLLASATAAVANYDYTPIEFNIDKQHLQPNSALSLELIEASGLQRAGIAVCSGTIFDSVCTENYRPLLEVTYVTNQLGQMQMHATTPLRRLAIASRDDYISCKQEVGCELKVAYNYSDPDANSRFRIQAGSLASDWVSTAAGDLLITIPNGRQLVKIVIDDGGELIDIELGSFDIGVIRPSPPKILYQDEFSSRSGIKFMLAEDETITSYQVEMCTDMLSSQPTEQDTCQKKILSQRFTSTQIELNFTGPYQLQNKYYYRFTGDDDYGNTSSGSWVSAIHNPELKSIESAGISLGKISPQNRDGKFDSTVTSTSGQDGVKLRVFNYKFAKLVELQSLKFTGSDAAGNFLPSGKYYLQLWGQDNEGYPYMPGQLLPIAIDNNPPTIW